jgi:hypothetical protein
MRAGLFLECGTPEVRRKKQKGGCLRPPFVSSLMLRQGVAVRILLFC